MAHRDAPSAPPAKRPFRTDIQALRAIAVGLVILNHLWPQRLAGGYIGVDIFFVISGYLISAHLLAEVTRSGRIRFATFYARRAKRLLPAALLVAFTSLAGVLLLMPPERWARIAKETFAASAYFENWLLAANSVDYSAQDLDATTVQHYWSLSVEEQFYLAWPLVIVGLVALAAWIARRNAAGSAHVAHRDPARLRTAVLLIGALVIGIASFVFAVWLTADVRALAYFHTLGRVWEFMAGALIAITAPAIARWYSRLPAALVWRGIAHWVACLALVWAALTFDTTTAFPGPWAAVPVLATALILATGESEPAWSPLRPLRWRPIQYAGDISYSLYLWHWPLIVLAPFALARDLRFVDRAAIILITVVLAAATKRFVEDPGRTRLLRNARPRTTLLVTGGSILAAGALAAATVFGAGAIQQREIAATESLAKSDCWGAGALAPGAGCDPFAPAAVAPQGDHNTPWFSPEECKRGEPQIMANGKPSFVECDFAKPGAAPGGKPPLVWLVGDSHAEHWKGAVYDIARGNGWHVKTTMQGGCPIAKVTRVAFKGKADQNGAKAAECRRWSAETTSRIIESKPDLILVSVFGAQEKIDDGSGRPQLEQYAEPNRDRIEEWRKSGAKVVVIRDAPFAGTAMTPDCVIRDGKTPKACSAPRSEALQPDPLVEALRGLHDPGVSIVDLSDRFCTADTCYGIVGGLPVYFDGDHISRSYSQTLAPALDAALAKATGMKLAPPRASTTTPAG